MIELHSWPTPNGLKVSIFLAEAGVEHRVIPVDIRRGGQFAPEFLAIAPNNRIPAIIDRDPPGGGEPISVFESGAILVYLANKYGQFFHSEMRLRMQVFEWVFWQMAGLGPTLGQNGHFNIYAPEKIPYAIDRYVNESKRLYGVLDKRLEGRDFIVDAYTIADMACYPWIVAHKAHQIDLAEYPNVAAWYERIGARPAVQQVYAEKDTLYGDASAPMTEEERARLFGLKK